MLSLRRSYPGVLKSNTVSYGGSQMWSEKKIIRECGCGPVAALDLLHYLTDTDTSTPLSLDRYNEELSYLCRRYLPLIPKSGLNGLTLAFGVNRLFHERGLPYRAIWAISGSRLWDRIWEMLMHDLPVILSIGPNFPVLWQKERLCFYTRRRDGGYVPSAAAKSHYVTVTGMDPDWLRISSWGREYYISRKEYEEFVKRHSSYLFSNLLYIKTTDP